MIAIEKARSGHPVIKKDGRWLASSFDPVKEAQEWARKATETLQPGETVFVLGIGSGYHVAELGRLLTPDRYLVIEGDQEIADQALRICPEIHASRVLVEPDWVKLVSSDKFRDVLCGVYQFAKHGPSCQIAGEYFRSIANLLIGRDRISFLLQLKARPNIWALLDPERVAELGSQVGPQAECISIKTLQKLFCSKANGQKERQLWRVLEELVA